jgi:hypothetical protein
MIELSKEVLTSNLKFKDETQDNNDLKEKAQ